MNLNFNYTNLMKYKYMYLLEYLPSRFYPTMEQSKNRRIVYNFKDGICPIDIKTQLVDSINAIKNREFAGRARVCFIPASSRSRTIQRYKNLSEFIAQETGCPCSISTITKQNDEAAGHIYGKKSNPAEDYDIYRPDVENMNIILVDDVITRGQTFSCCADLLIRNGAKAVIGLFLAKTIHPCVHRAS